MALFAYRTSVLESEVIKPLVLFLCAPDLSPVPKPQLEKALDVLESWMVRRMLVRATTKGYTRIVADLIRHLGACERGKIGDAIEAYFANSSSDSQYWPDDNEIREGLRVLPVYRRLGRGRLRMVLEAIEDHRRGWHGGETGLGVRSRT